MFKVFHLFCLTPLNIIYFNVKNVGLLNSNDHLSILGAGGNLFAAVPADKNIGV